MTNPLRRFAGNYRDIIPIYVGMILVIILTAVLQGSSMFTQSNITTLLVQIAPFILAAMAQSLIMLLGGIDLSIGAMISLASTLIATNLTHGAANWLVVIGVLVLTGLLGVLTGVLIRVFNLPAIVVTLATSFIWGGLALRILPTPGGNIPNDISLWIVGVFGPIPLMAVILILCFVVWGYLRSTRIGLLIYSVGNNPKGARATGLSLLAAHAWAYGLAGVFAGLAGIILSAQTGSGDPSIGTPFQLSSIAAAVLGGISFFGGSGKMAGCVAGGIVLGLLVDLLFYAGFASFYQYVAEGVILVLVVGVAAWRGGNLTLSPRAKANVQQPAIKPEES
ncbi:MAG TPA: ABC transporter permease [Ktedonobacteraceae bacterium]|jgi:ribose transport system permease protein